MKFNTNIILLIFFILVISINILVTKNITKEECPYKTYLLENSIVIEDTHIHSDGTLCVKGVPVYKYKETTVEWLKKGLRNNHGYRLPSNKQPIKN